MSGEKQSSFEKTPSGWASLWAHEISAARKALEKAHTQGDKCISAFLDERDAKELDEAHLCLYTANIQTKRALMFGNTPRVAVDRKFGDPEDDVGRVAGDMLQRLLNCDTERKDDDFAQAHDYALQDRLIPGIGCVRYRLEVEWEHIPEQPAKVDPMTGAVQAPAVPATKKQKSAKVCTDYVNWKDVLWNPARVPHEIRWMAYRTEMSPEDVEARFGKDLAALIPYTAGKKDKSQNENKTKQPWDRAEVWEIESEEHGKRFWWVEGFDRILDSKDDALGLEGFFSAPIPMLANPTTRAFVPRADYVLLQDQYREIDAISTRINRLQKAIRARGVYDKASPEVANLLSETTDEELFPAENWGKFLSGGGLKGVVDWLPLDMLVNALAVLRDMRREKIDLLHQAEGMADIMRGEATQAGATATEQRIKARYGSVRIQALQDEFARFATDGQRIKAEIIAKHFTVETIIRDSNVLFTSDRELAQPAAELIKSRLAHYRIEVKSETLAQTDYQSLQTERMEALMSVAKSFQAMGATQGMLPPSAVMEIVGWSVSGLRGSSGLEAVLDRVSAQMKKAEQAPKPPPPPDPKLLAVQAKGQMDLAKVEAEKQARLAEIGAEVQADNIREQNQAQANIAEHAAKQQITNAMKAADPFRPPTPPRGFRP